jgi:hypothetical protein
MKNGGQVRRNIDRDVLNKYTILIENIKLNPPGGRGNRKDSGRKATGGFDQDCGLISNLYGGLADCIVGDIVDDEVGYIRS